MTLLITFLLFAAAMLLMGVGLLRGKQLRGSCGGLKGACDCRDAGSCPKVKSLGR